MRRVADQCPDTEEQPLVVGEAWRGGPEEGRLELISKEQLEVIKQMGRGLRKMHFLGNSWIMNTTLPGTITLVPSGFVKENMKVHEKTTELRVRERPDPKRFFVPC